MIAIIATEVAAVEAAVAVQDATIELEMVEKQKLQQLRWQRNNSRGGIV